MATLIREVRLIMAENGMDPDTGKPRNNYKYWNAKLYDDDNVHAEWGRVGCANPDSGDWGGGATYLDKKVREKIKKGYTEQKTIGEGVAKSNGGTAVNNGDLHSIARAQLVKSNNPTLDRLIKRLVDANVHRITANTQITFNSATGLFATPLGIVTQDGLTEARDLLAEISPYVRGRMFNANADAILCKYLRIIPQSLGMKRFTTETFIPDDNAIQKQNDLIDSLEASYQALQSQPSPTGQPKKAVEQVFQVDLDVLTDARERQRIERWYESSKKDMHNYGRVKIREVYIVNVHEMTNSYENQTTPHQEVWHGTGMGNVLSILKSGIKVSPPATAAIAGKMMGNGIYGAINSSKSLGYTFGRWGQSSGDSGWLFICSFAMGRVYTTYSSCPNGPPHGYDSIWAKAGQKLYNDELVVYRDSQIKVNYVLEVK